MTTPSKSSSAMPDRIPTRTSGGRDAIELLTEDHENVKALFQQFEHAGEKAFASKKKLATQICLELTRHATAEEELFYPAVRAAGGVMSGIRNRAVSSSMLAGVPGTLRSPVST